MTIGISKDDLLNINPWQYDNQQDLLNAILGQCAELNQWLPIEQAPKDRRILLLYSYKNEKSVGSFIQELGFFGSDMFISKPYTYIKDYQPTHYQELPADPK